VTSRTSLPAKGGALKGGSSELRAYREGVEDGRNATDFGVDEWAYGPHASAYGRGVRDGMKRGRS
jgi:hypothetical protein